jgi:arylsulfatase A-like enzyme
VVEAVREGKNGKGPVDLSPGSVKQPNHLRCVRTRDYKLARYFDPSGKVPQEWEMYDLRNDPIEAVNLVEVTSTPPQVRSFLPHAAKMQVVADQLAALLAKLERRDL